jgi:hypothetical protein
MCGLLMTQVGKSSCGSPQFCRHHNSLAENHTLIKFAIRRILSAASAFRGDTVPRGTPRSDLGHRCMCLNHPSLCSNQSLSSVADIRAHNFPSQLSDLLTRSRSGRFWNVAPRCGDYQLHLPPSLISVFHVERSSAFEDVPRGTFLWIPSPVLEPTPG